MSRVLVTGAGGFIGRHTLPLLIAAGFEVDAVTSSKPPERMPAQVRWHRADLLEPRAAQGLVEAVQPSHLLHLAWFLEPPTHLTAAANLDWIEASLRLLRAFTAVGGRRTVLAGSHTEYICQPTVHCVEDETPVCPASLYGAAKHSFHVVAAAWARQTGMTLCWGRIFNIYGPHEHIGSLVGTVASSLLRGQEVATSHGRQVRDYLYVEELAGALVALLCGEVTGTVNVASGVPVRVADVIAAVVAQTGRPELVRLGARPQQPGEPGCLTADVRRLRDDVGFRPLVDLLEGAARTVAWWKEVARIDLPINSDL
jgi:nucleoside-diphosphate-sugar epimerase